MKLLSKEEFLRALEQDPSLFHKKAASPAYNNDMERVVMFDNCSHPFSMEEYLDLEKKIPLRVHTIHGHKRLSRMVSRGIYRTWSIHRASKARQGTAARNRYPDPLRT